MKRILIVLMSLLFIISCQKDRSISTNEIYSELYKRWIFISKVEWQNQTGLINSPKGIELFLGKLTVNIDYTKSNVYCLYYRTPIKNKAGLLTIVLEDAFYQCPLTASGNILYQLDNIYDLQLLPTNFELNLEFKQSKTVIKWNFPFYNLKLGSIHEKYKSEKELKKINGLSILPFDYELNSNLNGKGKKSDRFSQKSAIKCKTVNQNCETVGEDFCQLCNYGSFEVVDYACPNGGSRFCGINHCGEKNEPACLRGTLNKDAEIDGICNEGLLPTLNSEHILVCQ